MRYNRPRGSDTRSTRKPSGRTSVGLVLASLHTGASVAAWPGVADAAERADVDLFCFPGGRIGLRDGYEASRNVVYDLAAEAPLDGTLVWASSLSGAEDPEIVDRFVDRYRDIPLASLSAGVEGAPVVTIDYYGGMRLAIAHAAIAHGCRRIAFIRGPELHSGAQERYRAYIDELAALGIDIDPRLVSSPHPWDSGALAARELIEERGLTPGKDIDALVASSDLMALWAIREIQAIGYRIPEDLAVLGMNNTIESRIASPSLTTVDCPFARLGELGLSTLLGSIDRRSRGEPDPAPEVTRLRTSLVARRSCGCPPSTASFAGAASADASALARAAAAAARVPEHLERDWVRPIAEAWIASCSDSGSGRDGERFIDLFGRAMERATRSGMEIGPWHDAITVLRRSSTGGGSTGSRRADDLADRARVIASEAAERGQAYRAWELERRDEALRDLDHELLMSFAERGLSRILRERLPKLGVESAFVCRYEDYGPEGRATLVAGFSDGRDVEGVTSEPFPAVDLLPAGVFPDRRLGYVVEPLFFHDAPIGYALFEIGNRAGVVYERLRDSVSNALRGALMFERVEEAREKAVQADRIKSRLLSNVTHELRAPVDMTLRAAARLLSDKTIGDDGAREEYERIRASAEHQKRLVDDLLDLSRAEIDELDLSLEPLDPGPILRECFDFFASQSSPKVSWRLNLPGRMPLIVADGFRFKQILMNILGNAAKFTASGSVTLSAEIAPPELHIRVADTGPGIPKETLPFIFEPFVSIGPERGLGADRRGVGLGLSIARHLADLHSGSLKADSRYGAGSVFTLILPLPSGVAIGAGSGEIGEKKPTGDRGLILLVSSSGRIAREIAALAAARGLRIHRVGPDAADGGTIPKGASVAAIAWDSQTTNGDDRALFRRLRRNPAYASLPLIVLGGNGGASALVDKLRSSDIAGALALFDPSDIGNEAPILAADDDAEALKSLRSILADAFPGARIATARDGEEALSLIRSIKPRLVVLDLSMPGLTGIEVVKRMRSDESLYAIPAILITSKVITLDEVREIEGSGRVIMRNKGVFSPEEAAREAILAASGDSMLPAGTSAIVKKAVAFLNAHFSSQLTRWQVAQSVNASEDYLSRVFRKELGLTPWEYLTRLRVQRAKERLMSGNESVALVGVKVGFPDPAYFSRVFKKATGVSPQSFREGRRKG